MATHDTRPRPDACPGARKVHRAADGAIGRLRFPGGELPAPGFSVLADLAEGFGDGDLHLTSRGNVQIRGIRDVAGFADAVEDAGLLPHPDHDRMRNIIASPLTGRVGGLDDASGLAAAVDDALCAREELAAMPGRTLFAVDDGRGDVLAERPDLGVIARGGDRWELIVAGLPAGVVCGRDGVADLVADAASAWEGLRGTAWRIGESGLADDVVTHIPDAPGRVCGEPGPGPGDDGGTPAEPEAPVGWIDQPDGNVALAAGLRFGVLPGRLARAIAQLSCPVHVTPWYSLVFTDLDEVVAEQVVRVFAPNGLVFDANSTWLRVTACTGRPGCAKSLSDTRGDASHGIASGRLPEGRVHFSGCERRCGAPKTGHVEYLAVGDGEYEVTAREPEPMAR
ncbi:precorrin-3B synthase [Corynebacterium sp. 335C]